MSIVEAKKQLVCNYKKKKHQFPKKHQYYSKPIKCIIQLDN